MKPNTACGSPAASSAWQNISADFARDVDHAAGADKGVGRERRVDQQRDGDIAPLLASRDIDAVRTLSARREVGAGADDRVEVEVVAVDLRARLLAVRPERLELTPHLANPAKRLWRGSPVGALNAERPDEDATEVLAIGASAPVPFGIAQALRGSLTLRGGGRQIEFELQTGCGGFSVRRQHDLVNVFRGVPGAVFVVVLDGTRQIHRLRQRQHLFEAVEGEIVLPLRFILGVPARLAGDCIAVFSRRRRLIADSSRRRAGRGVDRLAPERDRREGAVGRRLSRRKRVFARAGKRRRVPG